MRHKSSSLPCILLIRFQKPRILLINLLTTTTRVNRMPRNHHQVTQLRKRITLI
ncbi:hypothetical protein Hanom_Chr07g00612351 [Helianthus anomalus]